MSGESFIEKQEENISIHIFSVSSAMVGVCVTVLGLLSIIDSLKKVETIGDELTAVDGVIFLVCCVISYIAIRTKSKKYRYMLEKIADLLFLIADRKSVV